MFSFLVGILHEWGTYVYTDHGVGSERLVLEEYPHCTCYGRPKTQRLLDTRVPRVLVQDGTGMENCNACANCWIVPLRIQRPFKRMLAVAIYPQ